MIGLGRGGIYTQMKYYSVMKKNKTIPSAAMWMKLETLILSDVSQKKEDKYHMISHIWNLIYGINETTCRKETNSTEAYLPSIK